MQVRRWCFLVLVYFCIKLEEVVETEGEREWWGRGRKAKLKTLMVVGPRIPESSKSTTGRMAE